MALIKVNTDKSGASALELTAHYKMTIYWGWQSVKPLQSWAILEYFQMSGGAKAPLALLGGSPLTPIIYTQVTIQSLTL